MYANLVLTKQSEFSVIHAPATFKKEERVTISPNTSTPGPAHYYPMQSTSSPAASIPRGKRQYLINEKEAAHSPGPLDYIPKYHYVVKN